MLAGRCSSDDAWCAFALMTLYPTSIAGLTVRSVCWSGERVLAGTKGSEVYEVSVQDQARPLLLVGGHSEGELWGLTTHPNKQVFATASDDKTVRYVCRQAYV